MLDMTLLPTTGTHHFCSSALFVTVFEKDREREVREREIGFYRKARGQRYVGWKMKKHLDFGFCFGHAAMFGKAFVLFMDLVSFCGR